MRCLALLSGAFLAACSFDASGAPDEGGDGPPVRPDAAVIDAAVIDARPPDAAGPDARPPCPEGYVALAGGTNRYRVVEDFRNWETAEADCEGDSNGEGTHLVVVDGASERDALALRMGENPIWIGTSDRTTENLWFNVTGEPTGFQPWGEGEPNDFLGGEDCVEQSASVFNDESCGDLHMFVCECDGRRADPRAY